MDEPTLRQKIRIFFLGTAKSNVAPYRYWFKCKLHRYQLVLPSGHGEYLYCPICNPPPTYCSATITTSYVSGSVTWGKTA